MAEHINKTDTLNEGRVKLNAAISDSNVAKDKATQADVKSTQALANSESTQTQLDTIVIEGDSSVEAAQARVDELGEGHATLKARIDDGFERTSSQLAQTNHNLSQNLSQGTKRDEPVVLFVLDDGKIEEFTKVMPIAVSKNVPFNTGIITSRVGSSGYMSWEQIHEFHDTGLLEVMSHTDKHQIRLGDSNVSEQEILDEVKTAHDKLVANGFNPRGFIYPFNTHSEKSIEVVQRYHDFAFTKTHGDGNFFNFPIIDNQAIRRTALGSYFDGDSEGSGLNTDSLEYYKYMFDKSKQQKSMLVYVLHPSETSEEQFGYLEDLIDYIKVSGGRIVKATEGYNTHGNIIQTRNVSISNTGEFVYGHIIKKEKNYFSANDDISIFPKNSIITSYFNRDGNEGMPTTAGTFITYNVGDQYGYAQQKVVSYDERTTWMRNYKDGWQGWVNANGLIVHEEINVYEASDPPTEYPDFTITVSAVSPDKAVGFPTAGVLTTYRIRNTNAYNSQELRGRASRDIWRRISNTAGTGWGTWEKVTSYSVKTDMNTYKASQLITDYPNDQVTEFPVNNSGAGGFPNDRPGVAKTIRVGDQPAYSRQEFRTYNRSDLHVRNVDTNGEWTEWKEAYNL